jgi:hypothetical protein
MKEHVYHRHFIKSTFAAQSLLVVIYPATLTTNSLCFGWDKDQSAIYEPTVLHSYV